MLLAGKQWREALLGLLEEHPEAAFAAIVACPHHFGTMSRGLGHYRSFEGQTLGDVEAAMEVIVSSAHSGRQSARPSGTK